MTRHDGGRIELSREGNLSTAFGRCHAIGSRVVLTLLASTSFSPDGPGLLVLFVVAVVVVALSSCSARSLLLGIGLYPLLSVGLLAGSAVADAANLSLFEDRVCAHVTGGATSHLIALSALHPGM